MRELNMIERSEVAGGPIPVIPIIVGTLIVDAVLIGVMVGVKEGLEEAQSD